MSEQEGSTLRKLVFLQLLLSTDLACFVEVEDVWNLCTLIEIPSFMSETDIYSNTTKRAMAKQNSLLVERLFLYRMSKADSEARMHDCINIPFFSTVQGGLKISIFHYFVQNDNHKLVELILSTGLVDKALLQVALITGGVSNATKSLHLLLSMNNARSLLNDGFVDGHSVFNVCCSGKTATTTTIQLLLNYGAHTDVYGDSNLAAIHLAASMNNVAVMKLLLQSGVPINQAVRSVHQFSVVHATPLAITSWNGCEAATKFLFDNGAYESFASNSVLHLQDVGCARSYMEAGYYIAFYKESFKWRDVDLLVSEFDLDMSDALSCACVAPPYNEYDYLYNSLPTTSIYDARLVLHVICLYGLETPDVELPMGLWFVQHSSHVDQVLACINRADYTEEIVQALCMHAIYLNRVDMVSVILNQQVNLVSPSMLILAAMHCSEDILQLLIDRLPHSALSFRWRGKCAVHYAAKKGNVSALRCLLTSGASVHTLTKRSGDTALHQAVRCKKAEVRNQVVKMLLEAGVRTDIRNDAGLTAGELAVQLQGGKAAKMIQR